MATRPSLPNFTLGTNVLSVSKSGTGDGTVTSAPAGIDCGSELLQNYHYDTPVTLTAVADPGSTFTAWSGDADCADGSVTIESQRAHRDCALNTTDLTIATSGTGSGTVARSWGA